MTDEQAMAARLTAIAKRLDSLAAKPTQTYRELDMAADLRFLLAHVETLTRQVAELEGYIKARTAPRLGGEPQYDCSDVDAFYLSQENRRLQQENARLTAEIAEAREACPSVRMQDHFDAPLLKLINNEVVRGFKLDSWLADAQKRAEQAEQQRDTALAALKQIADLDFMGTNDVGKPLFGECGTIAHAALAPAQETER